MRPIKLLSIFGEDKTKSGMLGRGVSNANTQSDEDPNFGDYIRGATLADADEQHKPGTWWDTPSGLIAAKDRQNNTDYFDNEDEARAFALGGINTTPPPGGDEEEVPDSGEEPAAPPVMQPQTALGKHLQPGQSPSTPQNINAPEHEMKPGSMIQDPKSGMWKTRDKYGNFDYFETPEDAQNYLQSMSADDDINDYDPSNPKFWADVPEENVNSREAFLMRNMMKDAYPPKNFPYTPNEPEGPDYDQTDDRFWPQDARDDWFGKDESLHEILTLLERNYKREYELYHSRPDQKKRRAQRNKTRRKFERAGKVRKGDGKDIHHRDGNTANLSSHNTVVMDRSKNRAMKERAPINPTPVQEDHIVKDDERLVLLVKQLLIKILKAKAATMENKELMVRKTLTPKTNK